MSLAIDIKDQHSQHDTSLGCSPAASCSSSISMFHFEPDSNGTVVNSECCCPSQTTNQREALQYAAEAAADLVRQRRAATRSNSSVDIKPRCLLPRSKAARRGQQQPAQGDDEEFSAERYLLFHKRATMHRSRVGPGRSHEMQRLYNFWVVFLQDNFNTPMYEAFKRHAEEDASHGHTSGLTCLFHFYLSSLQNSFDAELYKDFELLALRYQDYIGFEEGMECLFHLLTHLMPPGAGGSGGSSSSGSSHKQQQQPPQHAGILPSFPADAGVQVDPRVLDQLRCMLLQQQQQSLQVLSCHSPAAAQLGVAAAAQHGVSAHHHQPSVDELFDTPLSDISILTGSITSSSDTASLGGDGGRQHMSSSFDERCSFLSTAAAASTHGDDTGAVRVLTVGSLPSSYGTAGGFVRPGTAGISNSSSMRCHAVHGVSPARGGRIVPTSTIALGSGGVPNTHTKGSKGSGTSSSGPANQRLHKGGSSHRATNSMPAPTIFGTSPPSGTSLPVLHSGGQQQQLCSSRSRSTGPASTPPSKVSRSSRRASSTVAAVPPPPATKRSSSSISSYHGLAGIGSPPWAPEWQAQPCSMEMCGADPELLKALPSRLGELFGD